MLLHFAHNRLFTKIPEASALANLWRQTNTSFSFSDVKKFQKYLMCPCNLPLYLAWRQCYGWRTVVLLHAFFKIVVQVQFSAFPPQLSPPPSPISTPLVIVHMSFIIVPVNPSPFSPLSPPLSPLVTVSLFSISILHAFFKKKGKSDKSRRDRQDYWEEHQLFRWV